MSALAGPCKKNVIANGVLLLLCLSHLTGMCFEEKQRLDFNIALASVFGILRVDFVWALLLYLQHAC